MTIDFLKYIIFKQKISYNLFLSSFYGVNGNEPGNKSKCGGIWTKLVRFNASST